MRTSEVVRIWRGRVAVACVVMALVGGAGKVATAQEVLPGASAAKAGGFKPANTDDISYWYGSRYRTPFVMVPNSPNAADIVRNTVEYTHNGFWSLGSNFADVSVAKSNMAEPASGGGTGAAELYAILRSSLGLNELSHSRAFQFGPVRNVAIEAGANLETKNSSFAPAERTLYFGPKIEFAVPKGYLNVGLHARKEWNHEGVLGKSENYDPNFNIEPTWMLPFALGKVHMAYSGLMEFNTAKGKDSFGSKTLSEFLTQNWVALDVGAMVFHRAQVLDVKGGFWYWHNEYGKASADPGAHELTPMIGFTVHLDGGRATRRK